MAASFAENFRAGLRRHCAGLAFAVVLAMAAHGAALFDFTTAIPGDGWSDAPTKIWEAWWAHRSIFEDGRLPLWTDRIRYPDAGALFMSGPLLSGLAALLTPVVGLVPAYNLSLLFWMTLGAFGTYLLAQRLTGDRVAGLVAAMGYRFSPFVLAYVLGSGTAELTGLGLLPLALFYLHRSALGGCVRDGVWAGVWMAATLVSSAYVAALTVAFCCLLIPYVLLIGRRRPAAYWLMRDTPPHAVYWKGPAAAIGTTVAFAAIPLGLLFATINAPDSILAGRFEGFQIDKAFSEFLPGLPSHYVASVSDYFFPHVLGLNEVRETTIFYKVVYPGVLLWFTALYGSSHLRQRKNQLGGMLVVITVVCLFASTGPYMAIMGHRGLPGPWNVFYLAFYYFVPMFDEFMNPMLLGVWTGFGLSLMAAAGVAEFRQKRGGSPWEAGLLVALMGAEVFIVSPAPVPVAMTRVATPWPYEQIAAADNDGAVLELPIFRRGSLLMTREHFAYQVLHGHPIGDNVTGFLPDYYRANPFVSMMIFLERTDEARPAPGNTVEALARLSDDGFRYLVIDRESYAPEIWRSVKDILWAHRLDMSNEHDGYILVDLSVRKDEPASNEAIAAGE